jgi:signal transduction histidine kinase
MTPQTFADLGGLSLVCPDSIPTVLGFLDPSIAPPFLYYSYLPIIVVALLFGLFIFTVSRASLAGRLLLWLTIVFSMILASELFLWIATPAAMIHFVWAIVSIFHGLLAFLLVYFTYTFLAGENMRPKWQWLLLLPLLPIFFLAPTEMNLSAFDLANCESIQEWLRTYVYLIQAGALALSVFLCFRLAKNTADVQERRKAQILGVGLIVFFGVYILSNFFGDTTLVYEINLFGPLGMVAFLAIIAYLIVRYHVFNMRILGAQALVGTLVALIFAALFVRTDTTRYVIGATLVIAVALGILLIRSVKREVEQREHIEQLAKELADTNKRQEGLLHFIGHEVKGFLTKDAGAFAALADGDFGQLQDGIKVFVENALAQSRDGVRSVTDLLTASNQKSGTISYNKQPFDLKLLVQEAVEKARKLAEGKGLALSLAIDDSVSSYSMSGDKEKIGDNVLRNIIDNSIYYTPTGSVAVTLKKDNGKYIFAVKDTGVGISDEDKKNLFTEGGHGKESQKINAHSTGYGLYIAKNIVDAHGGTIRAESEGPGKGSTFTVELPA